MRCKLCTDVEYSEFICPSPTIDIPAELLDHIKGELTLTGQASLRSKRESTEKTVNFYLGFVLDGVKAYRDLRKSPIKDKAEIIIIHQPPTITKWDGVLEHSAGDSLQIQVLSPLFVLFLFYSCSLKCYSFTMVDFKILLEVSTFDPRSN